MKTRTSIVGGLAVASALCGSLSASASLKTYEFGGGSKVSANTKDPGLVIKTSMLLKSGTKFSLNDGGSTGWFNLFKISTDEPSVNAGEDTVAKKIQVTLDFAGPLSDATLNGTTLGETYFSLPFIQTQDGRVSWSGAVTVSMPGDRAYRIELSNATFNQGSFGLGKKESIIQAKITQLSSVSITKLSDPSNSLVLLGLGLIGIDGWRRLGKVRALSFPVRSEI